jgi:flagellar motility protein MotE (MotC chaperone)
MNAPVHQRKRRSGRGVLWIIAGLMLASGGIRLATGTATALAREVEELVSDKPMAESQQNCAPDESVAAVLKALNARQSELDMREDALADRISALNLAEQEIQKNLVALQTAEAELAKTLSLADDAAEDDLARLTAVYENMKPKEAAALFEEMSPDFAAGFLGRMRPDTAAQVMAGLSAPAAYTISVILAGRNANVPKN